MADSLNNSIQNLGDTLSAAVFGNSKANPEGAENFSGIYMGPGGGVTRADSFSIEGNRYGPAFLPSGYFDKTNQWIEDKLSSVLKEFPGISRENFPKMVADSRTGNNIQYSTPIGPYSNIGNGFTPPGFFNPFTNLWVDQRLSQIIDKEPPGIHRTFFEGSILTGNPGIQLVDEDTGELSPSGFTPVVYYRTGKEIQLGFGSNANGFSPSGSKVGIVSAEEAAEYSKKTGEEGFYESEKSSNYRFKFGIEDDKILSTKDNMSITPFDNEDPLFVGFEVIIDIPNSPLFNGEAAAFIEKFKAGEEIRSRGNILTDFITEFSKFFKFNTPPALNKFSEPDMSDSIFDTQLSPKRHYVKKIAGLDKLIESNTPSSQSAFVKYRNDLIKLSFYEDTTLNLGTLSSLYKLLYWSRINGKNIIPENLLRFDCIIIASEVRNLTRVVKAVNGGARSLQTLKENVSRYVYNLYECQIFFDKMTHGDTIDMSSTPSPIDILEVSFSYKFSSMKFERFNFNSNQYSFVNNESRNPLKFTSKDSNRAILNGDEILPFNDKKLVPLNNGYGGRDINDINISSLVEDRGESESLDGESTTIDNLKEGEKLNIYNDQYNKQIIENSPKGANIYNVIVGNNSENKIELGANGNLFKKAGEKLLQNVKKAALNEAQRQLNNQFRLVNNSIDKVRNSFGIGRMREPTNVYKDIPNAQFFFDVKNSLRDFGGDILGGLLGG